LNNQETTAKPVPAMTLQEAFEKAARGMLTQKKKALTPGMIHGSEGKCVLRAPDGSKCAVGHILPDECYDPVFDTRDAAGITSLLFDFPEVFKAWKNDSRLESLLTDLQSTHDSYTVREWPARLLSTCEEYRLQWPSDLPKPEAL
jgi:hypothetical protein